MKKYRFSALFACAAVFASLLLAVPASASGAEGFSVDARHALLMDAEHDEVLYEQDADARAYPASITKVMTALLVLEAVDRGELSLDQVITASSTYDADLTPDGSTQNIQPGEQLTVHQLLQCLLIASANEAANILAETVAGDLESFVALMNQRAAELGCTGTHFANAHGLHNDNHYTTAHDIYRFVRAAMEYDAFREIVSTADCYIDATNLSEQRHFFNTNGLLSSLRYTGYVYSGAIGVKSGKTPMRGRAVLAAAAERDGVYLISVVMGAQRTPGTTGSEGFNQFSESIRLLDYGFDNFTRRAILDPLLPLEEVTVTLSKEAESVMVRPADTVERTLPSDLDLSLIQQDITLSMPTRWRPRWKRGRSLEKVTLSCNGALTTTCGPGGHHLGLPGSAALPPSPAGREFFSHGSAKILVAVVLVLIALVILRFTLFSRHRRYGSARYSGRGMHYSGRRRFPGRRR